MFQLIIKDDMLILDIIKELDEDYLVMDKDDTISNIRKDDFSSDVIDELKIFLFSDLISEAKKIRFSQVNK